MPERAVPVHDRTGLAGIAAAWVKKSGLAGLADWWTGTREFKEVWTDGTRVAVERAVAQPVMMLAVDHLCKRVLLIG